MDIHQQKELLFLMKALAEESRMSLFNILTEGERSVGDLARQIELGEPTVSHHLAKLREAGLVTLRMEGNQRFYRANASGIARFKRLAANIDQPAPPEKPEDTDDAWISELGWSAEDERVLREYTRGRKLARIPSKQKALIIILRWLATLFETERMYSESEVNAVLKSAYEADYISLRRDLVDMGYLRRERGGGKYWLAPEESAPRAE